MGTNYYVECEIESGIRERLHIGKSSCGWVFSLRRYRSRGLVYWSDWRSFLDNDAFLLFDEYGNDVLFDELCSLVEDRSYVGRSYPFRVFGQIYIDERAWADNAGGVVGPRGLLRHRLKGGCVEWGEGTWDYIECEFS